MLNEINDEINNEINNSNNEIENKSETNEDGFLDSIYKQGNGAFTNKQNLYSGNEFNLEEMTKVTQSDALNFAPKNKRRMLLSWKTLLPSALAICLVFGGLIFMLTSQSPANTSKIGNTAEGALPAASASIAPIASGKLFADIQGEVNKAGLYELENGSRISDLIKAAGGL
ncbi:MAG: SLBB domain-containing protein, partial [Bifidobacteriaceae bacterium]|nr:SLBB domain-containing protein [Bifidobacteriaceae bacterium]